MYRIGHFGVNAAVAAIFTVLTAPVASMPLRMTAVVVILAFASLPDIDTRFAGMTNHAAVWQRVPVQHRGVTHTVWFALCVGTVTAGAFTFVPWRSQTNLFIVLFIGFTAGFLSVIGHLAGDVITPAGITPLTPLDDTKITLRWCTASNRIANIVFLVGGTILLGVTLSISVITAAVT
ncbi:metal-dependent hydrolase [Halovenus sp. HT40]|uniref:metal-dependent hydrolase n=1 Tax=Halovenus sp. HT40 TaxID=3126691 RepID=UPI00300F3971